MPDDVPIDAPDDVPGGLRQHRVTAVLVRGPGQPAGDLRAGLEIEATLDRNGALQGTPGSEAAGRARRFWPNRADWTGELVRLDAGWGLRGIEVGDGDDAPVWELLGQSLRPGAYVTLVRPSDAESVFRVVNVEAL